MRVKEECMSNLDFADDIVALLRLIIDDKKTKAHVDRGVSNTHICVYQPEHSSSINNQRITDHELESMEGVIQSVGVEFGKM